MALDSLPRWLRDLIEYNDELAGRDNGRMQRFLLSEDRESRRTGEKKQQRRFDELLRLLQNPLYAKLYYQAVETIDRVDVATDRVRRKLEREHEAAADHLSRLRAGAAELPDGRKVFRAKDGRLVAEDGTDVTDRKEHITGLSPDTASWENFRAAQEHLDEIRRQQREIDNYMREVIEPARERLRDPENPMTPDELREFQTKAMDAAPTHLRSELDNLRTEENKITTASPSAADGYVGPAGLNAPDLFAQFEAANPASNSDALAPPAAEPAKPREPYGSQATKLPATAPKVI
jgi:hypothetical protein